jgi:hypothetical protein
MYYYKDSPACFSTYCGIFSENFTVTNILPRTPRHRKETIIRQAKEKNKGHPCIGTEALYRLYGPEGE